MSITSSYPSAVVPWSGCSSSYLISDHEACLKEFSGCNSDCWKHPTVGVAILCHDTTQFVVQNINLFSCSTKD